jgi:ABC-type glycerol-3-phosphate transport system substrate-binding protein
VHPPQIDLVASRATGRRAKFPALLLAAALALAACDGDAASTTEPSPDGTISHQEITRQIADVGEVAFILITPGEYTQAAYEDLLRGMLAADDNLWGIEVFDDAEALEAGLSAVLSAEDVVLLREHHLVRVIARQVIRFEGPLSEWGEHPV